MTTVNSLSGGKTSSYIAEKYPADHELFALVTVEDRKLTPTDKGLVQRVSDKIGKEFIGTVESDLTLQIMFDLEQSIGREIIWLAGDTFEQVIKKKSNALPCKFMRFCTTEMKLNVIFEYCYKYLPDIVSMRVGFRYDEKQRAENFTTSYKYPHQCSTTGQKRQSWTEKEWRVGEFPLIDDGVFHFDVAEYWNKRPEFKFPINSNCLGCFWKGKEELRYNWEYEPVKMQWFADQEAKTGNRFRQEFTYEKIKNLGLQTEIDFGFGSSCQSGFCTD